MKTKLKAQLQICIEEFLNQTAEHENESVYIHADMAEHMTNAAEAVYDATFAASRCGEENSRGSFGS